MSGAAQNLAKDERRKQILDAAFAEFAMGAAARELILFSHTPMNSSSPLERAALEAELVRLALGYLQAPL